MTVLIYRNGLPVEVIEYVKSVENAYYGTIEIYPMKGEKLEFTDVAKIEIVNCYYRP